MNLCRSNIRNKVRLAKYIKEHNGIDVDPRSIFDVQVKRLHEYKRQFLNILHVMYLYNQIKEHPELSFYPRTFIFGAKAAAGYLRAKETIKLINSVADVVNNDRSINGKLKVVFIEDYRVSNAELIFAAADVSGTDFYGVERGIRYRKHEIYAERSADARNNGRSKMWRSWRKSERRTHLSSE